MSDNTNIPIENNTNNINKKQNKSNYYKKRNKKNKKNNEIENYNCDNSNYWYNPNMVYYQPLYNYDYQNYDYNYQNYDYNYQNYDYNNFFYGNQQNTWNYSNPLYHNERYNKNLNIYRQNTFEVDDYVNTLMSFSTQNNDIYQEKKHQNIEEKSKQQLIIDNKEEINVKERRKIIDTPNSLKELIDIINNNECIEEVEYNIDVKLLHNIKTELLELENMIGIDKIKQSVFEQLIYFIQDLHLGDNLNNSDYKHTVIMGPPGTGKTKVAKIIGKMYSKIGVLKNNIFKKVTRNDLIAGYLGQTALKTKKIIEECLGGVLFIDEAYSLGCQDKEDIYVKECLDTLCESLSDNKDNLMVIIAGYENELENNFFKMNNGLKSRFIWRFLIDKYNAKELMYIFKLLVLEQGWNFEKEKTIIEKWFEDKKDNFLGLGRDMEVLFTYTKIAHGLRIYGKDKEFQKKISLDDMNNGYKTFLNNMKEEKSVLNSMYV
jgi:SpoVK/Ycf46/Vps4 family AAA+-type ATPase